MVEHGYWPKVVMRCCKRRLESTSVTYKYTEHHRSIAMHLIFAVVTKQGLLGPGNLPKSHPDLGLAGRVPARVHSQQIPDQSEKLALVDCPRVVGVIKRKHFREHGLLARLREVIVALGHIVKHAASDRNLNCSATSRIVNTHDEPLAVLGVLANDKDTAAIEVCTVPKALEDGMATLRTRR